MANTLLLSVFQPVKAHHNFCYYAPTPLLVRHQFTLNRPDVRNGVFKLLLSYRQPFGNVFDLSCMSRNFFSLYRSGKLKGFNIVFQVVNIAMNIHNTIIKRTNMFLRSSKKAVVPGHKVFHCLQQAQFILLHGLSAYPSYKRIMADAANYGNDTFINSPNPPPTLTKNHPTVALVDVTYPYVTLMGAPCYQPLGFAYAANNTTTSHNRSGRNSLRRAASLGCSRSFAARRNQSFISANRLWKFHDQSQRLHWVERNAYRGVLRRFNSTQSPLAPVSSNLHYRLSFFIGRGFLLTENGYSWRYTKLHSGYRISYGIGNNGSARNKSANGYRLKLVHSRRTQTVYEYGVYSSRHIHTGSSNLGYSTSFPFYLASLGPGLLICPGGFGGGDGRGGAGGLATKVSLLESVGKPRMGKKGELGNQFSHMGGVA